MTEKNDILKDLFSRMPEEELPASFRANAIRQIMAEAERIRKRNERWDGLPSSPPRCLWSVSQSLHSFI